MKRYAWTGFAIWAAATLALRAAGDVVLRDASPRTAALLLAASLPLMIAIAMAVLRRCAAEERTRAAIALVAPGMLLDTLSAIFFTRVFPNLPAAAAGLFGGWLLFCNVVVLLVAQFDSSFRRRDFARR